jgi:hypothetical protein
MRDARYVFKDHVDRFLQAVLATSEGRKRSLSSGGFLWRAQQGDEWGSYEFNGEDGVEYEYEHLPLPSERMKPLSHSAREGQVNPKGIPCLYLANDKDTAMAETRPWFGSYLSIAVFKILQDLVLVDCSVEHETNIISHWYSHEPSPAEREKAVWAHIDHAFSEPVDPNESSAHYVPTQILAEAFRSHGYDGVVYKSLLGKGFNIALFDINVADLVSCGLYAVKSITFCFEQAGNSYSNPMYSAGKKKADAQTETPEIAQQEESPEITD